MASQAPVSRLSSSSKPKWRELKAEAATDFEQAARHEKACRFASANACYQKGLQKLLDASKATDDPGTKRSLREHTVFFMKKAEKLKLKQDSEKSKRVPMKKSQNGTQPRSAPSRRSPAARASIPKDLRRLIESEIVAASPNVKMDDIVGLLGVKRALYESIILPTQQPELFDGLRSPPRAILLFGPPGNGKTLIAKAIASEAKSTFFSISASTLTSKFVGQGEKLVRAMFELAAEKQPSIVFIDEIDSILSSRGGSNEHEASRRLKTEFLVRFDGVNSSSLDNVLIIAATNLPECLDEAVLRRFPRRFYIPLPEADTRASLIRKLLEKHANEHVMSRSDIQQVVMETSGYSASDLHELCKEASMGPIRDAGMDIQNMRKSDLNKICYRHFAEAENAIRPSVSDASLRKYEEWDRENGTKITNIGNTQECIIS